MVKYLLIYMRGEGHDGEPAVCHAITSATELIPMLLHSHTLLTTGLFIPGYLEAGVDSSSMLSNNC